MPAIRERWRSAKSALCVETKELQAALAAAVEEYRKDCGQIIPVPEVTVQFRNVLVSVTSVTRTFRSEQDTLIGWIRDPSTHWDLRLTTAEGLLEALRAEPIERLVAAAVAAAEIKKL